VIFPAGAAVELMLWAGTYLPFFVAEN